MLSAHDFTQNLSLAQWRNAIGNQYLVAEGPYLAELIRWLEQDRSALDASSNATLAFLQRWHQTQSQHRDWAQEFLHAYGLNTREGVVLMCLAEALVRIPDNASARNFIADKLHSAHWQQRLGEHPNWMINATTWALVWGERLLEPVDGVGILNNLLRKLGEPVIHAALEKALLWLADSFVFGADIQQALKRATQLSRSEPELRWHYAFDLLGEAAITHEVAQDYRQNYLKALRALQQAEDKHHFSLSIKLSALHPRYEALQEPQLQADLIGTSANPGFLVQLAQAARTADIALTVDAEEAERLELSLNLIEACLRHPLLAGWNDMGLAVQAYSTRALPVLGWLNQLASELGIRLHVRLVKGAYWDSEIYWAQRAGLAGYPVFTEKSATDIAYLACAKWLLQAEHLNPQFATHNASTIYSLLALAKPGQALEFQRLQGMGESLYRQLLSEQPQVHCRIYAPVGQYAELLPYLVRRLLENGANSSFVNQLNQADAPLARLAQHPLNNPPSDLPALTLPGELFTHSNPHQTRRNSMGINLAIHAEREALLQALSPFYNHHWAAGPIIAGRYSHPEQNSQNTHPYSHPCTNPANSDELIGSLVLATPELAQMALASAADFYPKWRQYPVLERAAWVDKVGDLLEAQRAELLALLIREGGKTLTDGLDEIREAVDFCRYYAQQAREHLAQPLSLPGPTGEQNQLLLEGRGVFVAISPWNFPLAIFTGQIIAALVAGNCVLAKPARQTSLIAFRAIELMLAAGIPAQALHFLPGNSGELSPLLTGDPRIDGIVFTGSTQSAWAINRALAARDSSIATLIAETGGQNTLIADSTCLPEQLVKDVLRSAFGSAGQRCSALRVLFVQEEIADKVSDLLTGAMACLQLGDPRNLSTDIGPVINAREQQKLQRYIDEAINQGRLIAQTSLPDDLPGNFVAPTLLRIGRIGELQEEHFGPICHLIRFRLPELDQVICDINALGYGLTLGIHSRNEGLAQQIAQRVNVGNVYINRNMVGAVVGVQPFGGCGLSGTGPKAGGPHYLLRFVREKTISNYLAAVGGNILLLTKPAS